MIEVFISKEYLVLVPVLYVLGMVLKQSKRVLDSNIPLILTFISIFLCILISFSQPTLDSILKNILNGIIQGVLLVGTTVYTNQMIKQNKRDKN